MGTGLPEEEAKGESGPSVEEEWSEVAAATSRSRFGSVEDEEDSRARGDSAIIFDTPKRRAKKDPLAFPLVLVVCDIVSVPVKRLYFFAISFSVNVVLTTTLAFIVNRSFFPDITSVTVNHSLTSLALIVQESKRLTVTPLAFVKMIGERFATLVRVLI